MTVAEHLSLVQVRAYVRGALHPSTLVTIDDHLEVCAACRAALARESDASFGAEAFGRAIATAEARPESPHLTFDALRGSIDGTLSPADAEWVEAHVALCVMCAEELRDLERFVSFVPVKVSSASVDVRPDPLPAPAYEPPVTRRRLDEIIASDPPPAYGVSPSSSLPVWMPVLAGASLLLLVQMWAC